MMPASPLPSRIGLFEQAELVALGASPSLLRSNAGIRFFSLFLLILPLARLHNVVTAQHNPGKANASKRLHGEGSGQNDGFPAREHGPLKGGGQPCLLGATR